jgi:hypothetical protein
MPVAPVVGRLLHIAASGVAGHVLVAGGRRLVSRPAAREATVSMIAGGLVAGRRLEAAAEETRLRAGDLVAEARARLGEEAPPPATPSSGVADEAGHVH